MVIKLSELFCLLYAFKDIDLTPLNILLIPKSDLGFNTQLIFLLLYSSSCIMLENRKKINACD